MKKLTGMIFLGIPLVWLAAGVFAQGVTKNGFPAAPHNGMPLELVRSGNSGDKLSVGISRPTEKLATGYPVAWLTTDLRFRGTLTYPIRFQPRSYIVQQKNGLSLTAGKEFALAAYPSRFYSEIFDPQVSPNGRAMLLKVGWPFDYYGRYDLFWWDFNKGKLQVVVQDLNHEDIHWSSSGQHIAYITGGTPVEKDWNTGDKFTLHIHDLAAKKQQQLTGIGSNYLSWTPRDTVLLAKISNTSGPDIFEVTPAGKSRLLLPNGYNPVSSPDGRWIAFSSWTRERDTKPIGEAPIVFTGRGIFVYDLKTKRRILLREYTTDFTLWSADSKHVLAIDVAYEKSADGKGHGQAKITNFDIENLQSKKVGIVDAWDVEFANRNSSSLQFRPLTISKDGRYLFLNISEFTGKDQEHTAYCELKSIKAIDLKSGEILPVASLEDPEGAVIGWDWQPDVQ